MKTWSATLSDVQAAYSGPELELWELLMGEQIHIGGMASSTELANRAGILPAMRGVDLCCCIGGGMRFLVRCRGVAAMTGVDATSIVIELGRTRCAAEGLSDRIAFVLADASSCGLPAASTDFVWGEDAWCYVADKAVLIAEAVRIAKPSGIIAFTDWVEGAEPMTDAEAERFMRFMKFPTLATLDDYTALLRAAGCDVRIAAHTGRFAPAMDQYLVSLTTQHAYDALKILGFRREVFSAVVAEMESIQHLAREGKIEQCMLVARTHP